MQGVREGEVELEKENKEVSWGIFEVVLTYVGVLILAQLYMIVDEDSGGVATLLGMANNTFNNFVLAFLFQFSVTILLVWLFTIVIKRASWRDLGVRVNSARDLLTYGLVGGLAILGLVMIFSALIYQLQPDVKPQDYEQMLRMVKSTRGFLTMLVLGAVLAPFYEELFFRGMIYPAVRRYLGPTAGAIVAGLIFGLAHWDMWRTIPLAIGGTLFCYIYEKTGSILVTALAHGIWNGVMALIIYLNIMKMV